MCVCVSLITIKIQTHLNINSLYVLKNVEFCHIEFGTNQVNLKNRTDLNLFIILKYPSFAIIMFIE